MDIQFKEDHVYVVLGDGRIIGNPLAWHPWLLAATDEQRSQVELYTLSAYWPELDNGLDVEGMMKGRSPALPQDSVEHLKS